MKLGFKMTILFLLLSLTPLGFGAYFVFTSARDAIEQETIERIEELNLLKQVELENWLGSDRDQLQVMALRAQVPEEIETILKFPIFSPAAEAARERLLHDHLLPLTDAFQTLSILSGRRGQVLVSTDETLVGEFLPSEAYFIEGQTGSYIEVLPPSSASPKAELYLSTPITGDRGELLGVLVGTTDFSWIADVLEQGEHSSPSMETYLIDRSNIFITGPRIVHLVTEPQVNTSSGILECLAGNDGTGLYENYIGIEVFGAYQWLPDLEICVVSEVSRYEAFQPVFGLRGTVVSYGFLVAFFIVWIGFLASRSISRPILSLVEGVEAIGRGDLDRRIDNHGSDEIGQLAASFNEMATNLSEMITEVAYGERVVGGLSQAGHALQRARTIGEVFQAVADEITQLGHHAIIFSLDESNQRLKLVHLTIESKFLRAAEAISGMRAMDYEQAIDPEELYGEFGSGSHFVFLPSIADRMAEVLPGLARTTVSKVVSLIGFEQAIYTPLATNTENYGLLVVAGKGLSEKDGPAIAAFASQTANALENAKLNEQIQEWANELERRVEQRSADLKQSEEKFRTAFNLAAIGRVIGSPDGRFIEANQAFLDNTHYAKEQVGGLQWRDIVLPSEIARLEGKLSKLVAGEIPSFSIELQMIRTDGTIFWANINAVLIHNFLGEPLQVVADIENVNVRIQAEQQLRYQATLLESVTDAVISADMDFVVQSWNKAAEEMYGYSADEALQRVFKDLLHPDYLDRTREEVLEIFNSTGRYVGRAVHIRRDGQRIPVMISVSAIRDEGGNPIGVVTVHRDISDQVRAENALKQSERDYRNLVDNALVGVFKTSITGEIFYVNEALAEMLGFDTPRQLIEGGLLSRYRNGVDRDRLVASLRKNGQVTNFEVDLLKKSGHIRHALISATLEGEILSGMILDVTGEKQAEAVLRMTLEELERSNQELEQFAYVASHDLQEPIRMITNFLELLELRYGGEFDNEAKEFVHYAVDGAVRMQRMIRDLLEYSRVGTRGVTFSSVDCDTALQQALGNLKVAIEESGARIDHASLPTVLGDESQLCQVFQNLIGNAIKFAGDEIPEIKIDAREDQANWTFTISDNGIGIDPEFSERIFVIFQRLHPQGTYSGSGIGLAISKRIIERHGGRIWVESEPGNGSTFFFSIPMKNVRNKVDLEQVIAAD